MCKYLRNNKLTLIRTNSDFGLRLGKELCYNYFCIDLSIGEEFYDEAFIQLLHNRLVRK